MSVLKFLKTVMPKKMKQAILEQLAINKLHEQVESLKKQMRILMEELNYGDLWERSRKRWCNAEPISGLTWGFKCTGDAFVDRMVANVKFSPDKSILEIGTGYGRILNSILKKGIPFSKYTGLDISEKNIQYLKSQSKNEKFNFVQGDVEEFTTDEKFDIIFSSLTFKHFFPTFERALGNLVSHMNKGGMVVFDLVEGESMLIEYETDTFIHKYTRNEVKKILTRTGLDLVTFDQVDHAPGFSRLLVIAKKLGPNHKM